MGRLIEWDKVMANYYDLTPHDYYDRSLQKKKNF